MNPFQFNPMQTSMGLNQMPAQNLMAGGVGPSVQPGQEQLLQLLMMLMGGGQTQPQYSEIGSALSQLLGRQMQRLNMHDQLFPGEAIEGDLLSMLMQQSGSPMQGLMGPQQFGMAAQMPGGFQT